MKKLTFILLGCISALMISSQSFAETTMSQEGQYIFNSLGFYIGGVLVAFMAAGFCMLESGLVTTKSVSTIAAKNIGKFAICSLVFFLVGYNLAYGVPEGGYVGSFTIWTDSSDAETGYSGYSDWFFQTMFVCATASIVSGAVAERIKIWPFFIFAAIMAGVIYPISMGWQWGGGWLAKAGFSDFAGSTLVHSTGGAAALAGAILIGPRLGRFTKSGAPAPLKPFAASSIPLVTLGVFILWLGWFGFNGGSQLAIGTAPDAIAVSKIFINTLLAGAGGVMAAAAVTRLSGKTDVVQMLNGCIGGLVAITAEPLMPSPFASILIGAVGGIIVVYGTKMLFALKIDDVVGAIPAHMFAGIWGTLIVPATNSGANFGTQLLGVISINAFVFVAAFIVWSLMKATMGIRLSKEAELKGTDVSETGVIAYSIRD